MDMYINKSKLKTQKGGHVSINSYFCNQASLRVSIDLPILLKAILLIGFFPEKD